ncbi:MAG: hypothetical protein HZB16_15620 [Armatimonadetes bacterium]|nr:hypothetical protein [Armatimonadota bacterium]
MTNRVYAAALAALAMTAAAPAAPLSVIDPPVTINAMDTRLSAVASALAAQTGVAIGTMAPGGNIDAIPEELLDRVDPKISLKAEGQSLRAVLAMLREQGLVVQNMGTSLMIGSRMGPQQHEPERPTVKVGAYRVALTNITVEDASSITIGGRAVGRQALTTMLQLETDSELASRTLLGAGLTGGAKFDGTVLDAKVRATQGLEYLPIQRGAQYRDSFSLDFQLPKAPLQHLDELTGTLAVLPEAQEVIFEFGDLAQDNQQQSEHDIDVTLVHCAEYEGTPKTWTAELSISMPLTDALTKLIRATQANGGGRGQNMRGGMGPGMPGGGMGPGMPGGGMGPGMPPGGMGPGMPGGGMGPVLPPGPPGLGAVPAAQDEPRVTILAQGPPPGMDMPGGVPGMGMPGGMPGMGMPGGMPGGIPGMGMPGMGGMGSPASHPLVPVVVLETKSGRRRMEMSQVNLQQSRDGDKRVVARVLYSISASAEVPRMLVGLIDPGTKVGSLPFAITDVELPRVEQQ